MAMRERPELSGGREEKGAQRVEGCCRRGVGLRIERQGREGAPEKEVRTVVGVLRGSAVVWAMRCSSMLERRMCSSSTIWRVSGSRSSEWYLSRRVVKRPVQ